MLGFLISLGFIGLVTAAVMSSISREREAKKERAIQSGYQTQKERADELLRTCTGLEKGKFLQASSKERQDAILDYMSTGHHPLSFTTEFPKTLWHIGGADVPLERWTIKPFTIVRTVSAMQANASYLSASAILYNAGLLEQKFFEIWAFSFLFEDGRGQLSKWEGMEGFENRHDISTVHDAIGWLVKYRYITTQAAREFLLNKLYQLEKEYPETANPSPERLAIEAARAQVS